MSESTRASYARLRLVWSSDEPLITFQSTSGQSCSQRSLPPNSRSRLMANRSEQGLNPYATLRRCPAVVSQRSAKSSRADGDMSSRSSFKGSSTSAMPHYHHTVLNNATPSGEFTAWCNGSDNAPMLDMAKIRRQNLARLIERDFHNNKSELARAYGEENPKPQYFSDLLREASGKSFGEKAARKIEEKAGIKTGQLDIPDSPLLHDETRRDKVKDTLRLVIDDLDRDEMREALVAVRKIQGKRRIRA
jgi:hypothetical protein